MTSILYQPADSGGWIAVAAGTRLLVIADASDDLVFELWTASSEPSGFQRILDLLTKRGLAATPSFALVEGDAAGSAARVIARGPVTVAATTPEGEESISGTGVSTWIERTLPAVSTLTVSISTAAVGSPRSLPLDSGVALVASISLSLTPSDAAPGVTPSSGPAEVPAAKPVAPSRRQKAAVAPAGAEESVDIEATRTDAPEQDAAPAQPADGYDYLFGDTVFRSVSDAAVPEAAEASEAAEPLAGDHDGHTVMTADIANLRSGRKSRKPVERPTAPPARSIVLALPGGSREPLSQPILVGRSPSVSKSSATALPRLITLGGGDQDISRNHAQFVLEGGTVVVTDLHSRNGTTIVLPGKEPQKLRAGEPTSVIVGTVVDLGGGLTLTIEDETEGKGTS